MSRAISLLLLLLVPHLRLAAGCITVDGDFIRASDLASILPGTGLPGDKALLPAPVVGARRFVDVHELRRLLRIPEDAPAPSEGLCFEQEAEHLTPDRIRASIEQSFPGEQITLRIADYSRYPIPKGTLEFPMNGLLASRATKIEQRVLWRGKIVARNGRSSPVWVRLQLETTRELLVAKRALNPGEPILASDLDLVQRAVFPLDTSKAMRVEEAIGRIARQKIQAGTPLRPDLLAERYDIEARQKVSLEVHASGLLLKLPVIADTKARVGDWVWLRQDGTGKRFRARVTGPGQAVVEITNDEKQTNDSLAGGDLDRQ